MATTHLMIDLETLGLGADAAVWEVGYSFWDSDQVYTQGGSFFLDVRSSVQDGRMVETGTCAWVAENCPNWDIYLSDYQPDVSHLIEHTKMYDLLQLCLKADHIWAKGATFDFPKLIGLFRDFGFQFDWPFRKERCMRTLMSLYPDEKMLVNKDAHGAGYDASAQAEHVKLLLRIKGRNENAYAKLNE